MMKTVSSKLTEEQSRALLGLAKAQGATQSEIIRMALDSYAAGRGVTGRGSCLDLAGELVGSVDAAADLSTHPRHMKGFGG